MHKLVEPESTLNHIYEINISDFLSSSNSDVHDFTTPLREIHLPFV